MLKKLYRSFHLCALCMIALTVFAACGDPTISMQNVNEPSDTVQFVIHLPASPKENELMFSIDGVSYQIDKMPTVSNPVFVFQNLASDDLKEATFTLADNTSGNAELYLLTIDGQARYYRAPMKDFKTLTDYLRTN